MKTIHVEIAGADVELPAEVWTLAERLTWGTLSTPEEKLAEFIHGLILSARARGDTFESLLRETEHLERYHQLEGVDPKELSLREAQQALRGMLRDLGVEPEDGDELQ